MLKLYILPKFGFKLNLKKYGDWAGEFLLVYNITYQTIFVVIIYILLPDNLNNIA